MKPSISCLQICIKNKEGMKRQSADSFCLPSCFGISTRFGIYSIFSSWLEL